jgi:hypothetical protein
LLFSPLSASHTCLTQLNQPCFSNDSRELGPPHTPRGIRIEKVVNDTRAAGQEEQDKDGGRDGGGGGG